MHQRLPFGGLRTFDIADNNLVIAPRKHRSNFARYEADSTFDYRKAV